MMTELAKVLRKIRIDHGEILKSMADKLGVTSSYLSAIENGKRPMPEGWVETIGILYRLTDDQKKELRQAADFLAKSIKIDFSGYSSAKREAAVVFARRFDDMDEEMALKIKRMLNGESDG